MNGTQLKLEGIDRALTSAENSHEGWQKECYSLLESYLKVKSGSFQCEDFRAFCLIQGLKEPPSKRAFGGIILKASKKGLIKRVGYEQVTNPRAHCANAAVWEKQN